MYMSATCCFYVKGHCKSKQRDHNWNQTDASTQMQAFNLKALVRHSVLSTFDMKDSVQLDLKLIAFWKTLT